MNKTRIYFTKYLIFFVVVWSLDKMTAGTPIPCDSGQNKTIK